MISKRAFFAAALLLASAGATMAQAAPPLVNPVQVNVGTPVHLTPRDQSGVALPIQQCTLIGWPTAAGLPGTLVTFGYDATGVVITAVGPGTGNAQWQCVNAGATVFSATFAVTVPWSVTAVGDTMP